MSFWDNVKKFTQPYADDEYDDYDDEEGTEGYEEEEETAPRFGRRTADPVADSTTGFDFDADSDPISTPAAAPATSVSGFSGQVVGGANKQQVVLFRPNNFNDTSKAADDLRSKKAVIVNMENVDKAMARRVVDFLSGCAYAMDGKVKKIAQSTYLFCPFNMDIVGDLENLQSEVEHYV